MITFFRAHRNRDERNRYEPFNFQIEEIMAGSEPWQGVPVQRKRLTVSYDDRLPDGGIVTRIVSLEHGDSFSLHRYNDNEEMFEARYTYHADRQEGDVLDTVNSPPVFYGWNRIR